MVVIIIAHLCFGIDTINSYVFPICPCLYEINVLVVLRLICGDIPVHMAGLLAYLGKLPLYLTKAINGGSISSKPVHPKDNIKFFHVDNDKVGWQHIALDLH